MQQAPGFFEWRTLFGVFQWTLAIASVLGTLALFTWIVVLFVKKDDRK